MPESVLEAEGRKRARSCQEQTKVKEGQTLWSPGGLR